MLDVCYEIHYLTYILAQVGLEEFRETEWNLVKALLFYHKSQSFTEKYRSCIFLLKFCC